MRLTPRLQTIADFVPLGSRVADIGTDHGYIPVYLAEKEICNAIIAADINEGPLKNAERYISQQILKAKIELRLGNGFEVLKPGEVDTVIIAGMGGLLISELLQKDKAVTDTIDHFILQPMVAAEELRRFLYDNNFKIIDEKLAREGNKFYEIILATHGKDSVENDIYYEIGRKLIENKDSLLKDFLLARIKKIENIINNLKNSENLGGEKRYRELRIKHTQYLEVLKGYDS